MATGRYASPVSGVGKAIDDSIQYVGDIAEDGTAGIGELFGELFIHHGDARKRSFLKLLMLSFIVGSLIYAIIALHHIDERQHRIENHLTQNTDQNTEILANLLVWCDTDNTDAVMTVGCALAGAPP